MILFEENWEKYAVNHLKSKALARGLIINAATALSGSQTHPELLFWIEAALGGACVLNVLKGLHQEEGVFDEVTHLRMRLYIEGSKKGDLKFPNTAFETDFHLYSTILNPSAAPVEQQLQPTRLTYKTAWHEPAKLAYHQVTIPGARVLTNNLK